MTVPVLTAAQAAALDAEFIAQGNSSRALMQRAGNAAATEILRRFPDRLQDGVAVFAGPGNNGGDAWVLASALAAHGVSTRIHESREPASADARAERESALATFSVRPPGGGERLVVDGLLGTGSIGSPRGAVADAVAGINAMRARGARVVSLDLPTGLDASTGASELCVVADLTASFGSVKRGHLLNRTACGRVIALDIGLGALARRPHMYPQLIDRAWVLQRVPAIHADAHKGSRRRLNIVGGSLGMAGAAILAARAAFRSGVGLVRLHVQGVNVPVVQAAEPQALAASWLSEENNARELLGDWPHATVIGPGLGTSTDAAHLLLMVASHFRGPLVVDADAITIFANRRDSLVPVAASQPVVLTPHAGEMARLTGVSVADVLSRRFEIAGELASATGAVVLLKGVPTIIAAPDGRVNVSAAGSPVLATGGSGDILAGILGTLAAQMSDLFEAATCAAWVHGRAGELAAQRYSARGAALQDVLEALSLVWNEKGDDIAPPVLAELPEVR